MRNERPEFDSEIQAIADYVLTYQPSSSIAIETAYYTLLDSMACGLMALQYPACQRLLGPVVANMELADGVRIPGLSYCLDPVQGAFNIGAMIRWLDFNDTWLAQEWGHPSDNLGAILAVSDYLARTGDKRGLCLADVLSLMIKAHEIQGVLALENSFNSVGLDHVLLVKVASTAAVCQLLGLTHEQTCNALSHAWLDGQSLRTYRHAPNTGSRKSWAAGDACSRAVRLSLLAQLGEMGYPSAITAPTWGFQDALFSGRSLVRSQGYGEYVMENVLWKISFPAEFHAQTAVECALVLHEQVKDRIDQIERIEIHTQEAAVRIIDKAGTLHNPADRDHCLQYMVAIGLLFGELTAAHYEDKVASDSRIDQLRGLMQVQEHKPFSVDYLDPQKRSIGNAIQVFYQDGTVSEKVAIEYPIGHRRRRSEGVPLLLEKFDRAVQAHFDSAQADEILQRCHDRTGLSDMSVDAFMDLFHVPVG